MALLWLNSVMPLRGYDIRALTQLGYLSVVHLKGVYTLIVYLRKPSTVEVGKLGSFALRKGLYLYTGSAMGRGSSSLEARLRRHMRRSKKAFWHIDYLLMAADAELRWAIYAETKRRTECTVSRSLQATFLSDLPVVGFGSSDCNCRSHLLRLKGPSWNGRVKRCVQRLYERLGLRARLWPC